MSIEAEAIKSHLELKRIKAQRDGLQDLLNEWKKDARLYEKALILQKDATLKAEAQRDELLAACKRWQRARESGAVELAELAIRDAIAHCET